jgi:periplasmic protein TonB
MLERRPDGVYWAFGIGSVALHVVLGALVLFGGNWRREEVSAQPVELVSLPSGVLDPLAPILPDPVPDTAQPPDQKAPPPPADENQPPPPPPPKHDPDEMQEPNKVKNVKTAKPTPPTQPTPRLTPKPTPPGARVVATPRLAQGLATPASTPRVVQFALRQRRGVPNGFDVSGAMSFDNESFNFAYYGTSLQTKLSNNFFPPPNAFVPGRAFETTVFFVIGKNGELIDHRIDQSSGFPQLDEAAERAVLVSQPYPPLPVGFRGTELGVTMRFRCGQ